MRDAPTFTMNPPGGANVPPIPPRPPDFSTAATQVRGEGGGVADLGALPTLRVVSGRAVPMELALDRARVKLGRAPGNDVRLEDDAASRAHAEVYFEDGQFWIADLGSSNGVVLDGQRVEKAPLLPGQHLRLGGTELLFAAPTAEVAMAERLALLDRCELLRGVDAPTRESLARSLVARAYPREAVIVRQGAPIDRLLFVRSGAVRLVEVNDERGERPLGRLGAGEVFGERALLPGEAGRCALIADQESCLLELPRQRLDEAMAAKPDLGRTVMNGVRDRLSTGTRQRPEIAGRADRLEPLDTAEVVLIGEDKKFLAARKRLEALAAEGQTALLVGAAGTGKRTFARHYHRSSPQQAGPYLEVSLADLEADVVEGALFGIEAMPGAASAAKPGYLELLDGGTLVVGHAERLDPHLQAQLAMYLKLGWFHRQYGQQSVAAKTRVVLLAEGPEAEITAGLAPQLRAELGANLLVLPGLAHRGKDVLLLAEHFMALHARREGKRVGTVDREAADRLVSYAWPGNLTELENVIQRAVIVSTEASLISSDLIFVAPPAHEAHKLNLLRNERWRKILTDARWLRTATWINIAFIGVVLWYTLRGAVAGPGRPLAEFGNNFGMLVTWLVWFPLLPLSAFVLGRVWCGMCPIAGIGELATKFKRLDLPVPKIFRRLDFWLVAAAFLFLDYIEEFIGVADRPGATAGLLIVILGLAIAYNVVFERKAFCRYLCPLASLLGSYAGLSALEVRGNRKICQTQCGRFTCYKGSATEPGCPLASYPASINSSYECMMCGHCLRSCENRGVQVNLRPPLSELWRRAQPMLAMSLFALALVGMMAKHQFGLLTLWQRWEPALGWTPGFSHTVLFTGFILAALVSFLLAGTLSAAASQETVKQNLALYGVAFVPLAFAGHLAHLGHEFLSEGVDELAAYGGKVFGWLAHGVPIGVREVAVGPLVAGPVITFLKFSIVSAGLLGSLVALVMIARRVRPQNVFARALPHLLLLGCFWLGYLFIFTASTAPPEPSMVAAAPIAAGAPVTR